MDAFIFESLFSSGWKRGGETYWTLETAKIEARRLVRRGRARQVRILPLSVGLEPVATVPESEPTRESEVAR